MTNGWNVETPQSKKLGMEAFFTDREKKCEICGFSDVISIHYIVPLEEGGAHCEDNVAILCLNHEFLAKTKKNLAFSKMGAKREGYSEFKIDPKKKEEAIRKCCGIMFSGLMETLFTEKHFLRDVEDMEPEEKARMAEYKRLMAEYGLNQEELINFILRQSPDQLAQLTGGFPTGKM